MIQRLQKDRFLLQLSEQLSNRQQADLPVAQLERFVSRLVGAFESSSNPHIEWKNWAVLEQTRKLFDQSSYVGCSPTEYRSNNSLQASRCIETLGSSSINLNEKVVERILCPTQPLFFVITDQEHVVWCTIIAGEY